MDVNAALFWVDLETTGLDEQQEYPLSVAALATDKDLNELDPDGYEAVIYYPDLIAANLRNRAVPFVRDMHTTTRLWEQLPTGKLLSVVDSELTSYFTQFAPEPRTSRLCGNSITLDRNFMRQYLPTAFNHLHYRSVDVSSIAGPASWWGYGEFQKQRTHSAFDDIRESLAELRWLKKHVFDR